MFYVPCVRLTPGNRTRNSLERSLARSNMASLADISLSSKVQRYKIIIISSSYDWSLHDWSYPMSPVLNLAHDNSQLTRAKSWLTQYMRQLTRANEYIKTLPSNQWYTSTELGISQSIFIFSNRKQVSYSMRITTSLLLYKSKQGSYSTRITKSSLLSKLICGEITYCRTSFSSHHVAMA